MKKTCGNVMLTNLQPALRKLTDKKSGGKVRSSWNQLFLEVNNKLSTNATAFVLFVFCAD